MTRHDLPPSAAKRESPETHLRHERAGYLVAAY
jgi:hypothetical protein